MGCGQLRKQRTAKKLQAGHAGAKKAPQVEEGLRLMISKAIMRATAEGTRWVLRTSGTGEAHARSFIDVSQFATRPRATLVAGAAQQATREGKRELEFTGDRRRAHLGDNLFW